MKKCLFYKWTKLLISLCFLVSLLSACQTLQLGREDTPISTPPVEKKRTLFEEAEHALSTSDFKKAEYLSQIVSKDTNLSPKSRARALQISAYAAVKNTHPNMALTSLDEWRKIDSGADTDQAWQDTWCGAMKQLSSREARTHANDIYQDSGRSPVVRGIAAIYFAVRQWEDNDLGETMAALESIYNAASSQPLKGEFETRLSMLLAGVSTNALSLASSQVSSENQTDYPYNIILISQLHRKMQNPQTKAEAQASLDELKKQTSIANPDLFENTPKPVQQVKNFNEPSQLSTESKRIENSTIALALPLSKQHGSISSRIVAGAEIACSELSTNGQQISLVVIDTDSPDWTNELEAKTKDVDIVGGPLRSSDYSVAKSKGLLRRKAFFAFMQSLEGEDEGTIAWRFFPSSLDQVRSIVNFTSSIGVSKYSSLYPEDSYGQRMTELFKAQVSSSGGSFTKAIEYKVKQPATWLKSSGQLFSFNRREPTFQAIFLPDSWKNIEELIPNILSYNGLKQIIIGTALWEQALSSSFKITAPDNYALAIFPGIWDSTSPSAKKLLSATTDSGNAMTDMWTAIGYDFVKMATQLQIKSPISSGAVNDTLQHFTMNWGIAPLNWDSMGVASQDMFILTPKAGGGSSLVDRAIFQSKFDDVWQSSQDE